MFRVKDQPDHFLMHEWGDFFEEVTASSLYKIRMDGKYLCCKTNEYIDCKPDVINMGCVPVARAIFKSREDVNCIIHVHPYAVMAVASTENGFELLSQASFMFNNRVS